MCVVDGGTLFLFPPSSWNGPGSRLVSGRGDGWGVGRGNFLSGIITPPAFLSHRHHDVEKSRLCDR